MEKKHLWTGRIMSALPALFLLVDGGMKLIKPAPVVEATVRLGFPESAIFGLGEPSVGRLGVLATTMFRATQSNQRDARDLI